MQINNPVILDHIIDTTGNTWRLLQLEIGAWNMDTTPWVDVAHDLGATILNGCIIDVQIFPDGLTPLYPLNMLQDAADPALIGGGVFIIETTHIRLMRRTGGWFDNAVYDNVAINRGYVNIWYRES